MYALARGWLLAQTDLKGLNERELLVNISTKLDLYAQHVEGLLTKVVIAMIAVASASVGLKFMGSPVLTIVSNFLCLVAGVFVLAAVVLTARKMRVLPILLRLTFAGFLLFRSFVQTFVYHPGETPAPWWFLRVSDLFFFALAALLLVTVWQYWDNANPLKAKGD